MYTCGLTVVIKRTCYVMLSYTVLQGNPGISKNKGKLTETLFQTLDLENFASARRPSNLLDKAGRSGQ